MRKVLFVFFLCIHFAQACALCALQTPTAHVNITFSASGQSLNELRIHWLFAKNFTEQLYANYDINKNKKFEIGEQIEIRNTLVDYLKTKNYLSFIYYYDKPDGKSIHVKVEPKKLNFSVQNNQISFSYSIKTDIKLTNNRVIKFEFLDDEGYFNFLITNNSKVQVGDFVFKPNTNYNASFFEISKGKLVASKAQQETRQAQQNTPKSNNQDMFLDFLKEKLTYYTNKIKTLFAKSKRSSEALILLMFFSFMYGVFHAAGPGHGKMLVGSYFLSNGGSYIRAFGLCLKIAFIHVLGAFLLVLTSVAFVKTFISNLVGDVSFYVSIIAGSIVLALALYLLYKKLTKTNNSCSSCGCEHHEHSCTHSHSKKQEWGLAFAAGGVPCPGTIAIFVLAFSFGDYLSGFLSALALALGMSFVIFFVSVFGNIIHKTTSKSYSSYLSKIEYIGLVILAILGLLMLLSAFDLGV